MNGAPANAVARIKCSFVRLDKAAFAENRMRIFGSGQVGTLHLRHGVVTDDLTTVTFCAESVENRKRGREAPFPCSHGKKRGRD